MDRLKEAVGVGFLVSLVLCAWGPEFVTGVRDQVLPFLFKSTGIVSSRATDLTSVSQAPDILGKGTHDGNDDAMVAAAAVLHFFRSNH